MPDPRDASHATETTDLDAPGALDATLVRPGGAPDPLAENDSRVEPKFAPPQHAGEIGTFGRYRVLKKLGQGGMGAVYLGYDSALERKVALKVMLRNQASDPEARERFLREARSAAKVKSDHVVTIHDVGEESGVPFIAMEYLLGFPLDHYLRTRGPLPLEQVLRVCRETAMGLAAAHELGLIHRDVKPGNIWLEAPKGRVKLLDFGLARRADDDLHLTGTGAVMGTPAFMSPEQARGLKLDHRTDLFSLGVMLYWLATGNLPFRGTTTMAVLTSLAVDTPRTLAEINPELPEALELVVAKLLAKNPDHRYQSANEVVDALLAIERAPNAIDGHPLPVAIPMAIGVQTQNVWDAIDASGSQAVPLATDVTLVHATPTPAPGVARKKLPERKPSKLPAVLACAGLLLACAVLAVVLLWSKKKEPEVAKPPEPDRIEKKLPKLPKPPLDTSADRKAAEFVLARGGTVKITFSGLEVPIQPPVALPNERFVLTEFALAGKEVTSADLDVFRECKALKEIKFTDTNVGEAGLKVFEGNTRIERLSLERSPVTDVSLSFFAPCTDLRSLSLRGTGISDYGASFLKGFDKLAHLVLTDTNVTDAGLESLRGPLESIDLRGTKVTDKGVAALAVRYPRCRIEWNAGTIEPSESLDPDRRAAEYVLSIGGLVRITDAAGNREIRVIADLPRERFTLTAVAIVTNDRTTDDGLAVFKGCLGLTNLNLENNKNVTDAGLAHFKDCKSFLHLVLAGTTPVTDAGLAHFKGNKDLQVLYLHDRPITDAGLENFKDCTKLTSLVLKDTRATDAGLAHFAERPGLTHLDLNGTKVTDAGLDHVKDSVNLTTLFVVRTNVSAAKTIERARALPRCRIEGAGGTILPATDPDRTAAEYALSVGGSIRVKVKGTESEINPGGTLPKEQFTLTMLNLSRRTKVTDAGLVAVRACNHLKSLFLNESVVTDAGLINFAGCTTLAHLELYNTNITDTGLGYFKDCKNLGRVGLGNQPITDAGLAPFKDCTKLAVLAVSGTRITDAGLAHFKDRNLTYLDVHDTQVTDAGLDPFKNRVALTTLFVQKTKVTPAKVAELAEALPNCRIEHDGGVIEPTKK